MVILWQTRQEKLLQMFFAAGDVRNKTLRQVVTAVSDGANAATSIKLYIKKP